MEEFVVLVDEQNNEIGSAPKNTVHTKSTPLHRGFSLFLFNSKKELLLTKRSKSKKTFPGVWTNTVCGHPGLGESAEAAAKRRLNDELGIKSSELKDIKEATPYRYKFADVNGIVENEICPILVGYSDANPKPAEEEVDDWKWISISNLLDLMSNVPKQFSPWIIEEIEIVKDKIINKN